jgi:putative membrane protein insertion efficiency factor
MPPAGDTGGMGHGDSSEEGRGESGVCGIDDGIAAVVEECELEVENFLEQQIIPAKENRAGNSAAVKTALFALRIYKSYFSMLFAGACRFTPTCSRYAYEAIERFGAKRGSWLALKRLLRCQPLSGKFGYDPVPETWEDMHSTKFDAVESQEQRQDRQSEVGS